MNLPDRVLSVIQRHDLLPVSGALIVGVSGGTDSLALLHVLAGLRVDLHVATLDHGLRGAAGADDARFVVAAAQAWGLPVTAGVADVGALARERQIGIEAAARMARYDFLASVARAVGAQRIAVAHNADDQAETVLLHLMRGSGLGGLAGMAYAAPLPGHPDLTLIRPLLDVSRADLAAYCRDQGLQPRHDASNDDPTYTRNHLRREVIPYLRELAPQIERNLLQLAEIARVEDDFVESALHAAIDPHVRREEGRISLPRDVFMGLHPALQRRFVVWAAHSLGEAEDTAYVHVTAAVELALTGQVGALAQFRGGLELHVDYGEIVIERAVAPHATDSPLVPLDAVIPVMIPGETLIAEGWSLSASLTPLDGASLWLAIPDGATVVLRARRAGERFAPLGLAGHRRKLSEWMIDHKVPREVRDRVPLLVVNGEIAAILWHSSMISEKFAVQAGTERVVYFRFVRKLPAQ